MREGQKKVMAKYVVGCQGGYQGVVHLGGHLAFVRLLPYSVIYFSIPFFSCPSLMLPSKYQSQIINPQFL